MRTHSHSRLLAAALAGAVAAVLAALAGVALADVLVYSNTLATKRDGKELHHFEGKAAACSRHVRKGSLLIQVTGKAVCGYRLPLEGDAPQPDHALHARLKLGKQTPKALRKKSFLGLAVRTGGGTGYTLRILPQRHQFKLRRLPHAQGFNVAGKDGAIKPLNMWNDVRLQAVGTKVVAVVNGKKVADADDSAASGVKGRKAEVFVGANKANATGAFGRVDDVRLSVPSP
jgi:3-keto-disaccharide hydrolase